MQYHRASTFGVGMNSIPLPSAGVIAAPYEGWVAPSSDRVNAERALAWLNTRVSELSAALFRSHEKCALLRSSGVEESGLQSVLEQIKSIESEIRLVDGERRVLDRKVASLDRKDLDRRAAEESARFRYLKLSTKRTSVVAHPFMGARGHIKRPSIFGTPTFIPGFDPATSAMAAAQAPDLNLESPLDQELFLERVAAREKRDSIFEAQFGRLSIPNGGTATQRRVGAKSSPNRFGPHPPNTATAPMAHRRRPSQSQPAAPSMPSPTGRHAAQGGPSRRPSTVNRVGPAANGIGVMGSPWSDTVMEEEDTQSSSSDDDSDASSSSSSSSSSDSDASHSPPSARDDSQRSRIGVSHHEHANSIHQHARQQNRHGRALSQHAHTHHRPHAPISEEKEFDPSPSVPGVSRSVSNSGSMSSLASGVGSDPPPKARPSFLVSAAEASACDLSGSLANFLAHAEAPKAATATEALIDPHLREKISKALQAYIKAETQRAMDMLEAGDMYDVDSVPSSSASPSPLSSSVSSDPPRPSPAETLLWGLLMGSLRTDEEEQLAIEWWSDREKQLYAEAAARMRKKEERQKHMQLAIAAGATQDLLLDNHHKEHAFNMLSGSSYKHAARGAVLNQLSLKQEELRQLKAGQLLLQLALKSAVDTARAKELARTHGAHHMTTVPSNSIEPMCRRFVNSVVASALANAGILARQDRQIKELKWALSKAKRIAYLTANGSINRSQSDRPAWISAVSKPTPMPKLTSEQGPTAWITVEPDPTTAAIIAAQAGRPITTHATRSPSRHQPNANNMRLADSTDGADGSPSDIDSSRPGRGWVDPLYTPPSFDPNAPDHYHALGGPQRTVLKIPRPATAGVRPHPPSVGPGHPHPPSGFSSAGWPSFLHEDGSTRAAVDAWLNLRSKPSPAAHTTLFRRGSTASLESGSNPTQAATQPDPPPIYEDISLLGSPPALHVSPAIIDEWSLFVHDLDAREAADKVSLIRSAPVTSGPSVDPTKRSTAKVLTPSEKFASGASVYGNPLMDIPAKDRPRTAYQGLTVKTPHPDKQGDINQHMMVKDAELKARARRLAKDDGGKLRALLRASAASFSHHFRPSSNSLDWLPIDPDHPARHCVAGCRVHYEVDANGATALNPLGTTQHNKNEGSNNSNNNNSSSNTARTYSHAQQRPKSAHTLTIRRPHTASSSVASSKAVPLSSSIVSRKSCVDSFVHSRSSSSPVRFEFGSHHRAASPSPTSTVETLEWNNTPNATHTADHQLQPPIPTPTTNTSRQIIIKRHHTR